MGRSKTGGNNSGHSNIGKVGIRCTAPGACNIAIGELHMGTSTNGCSNIAIGLAQKAS